MKKKVLSTLLVAALTASLFAGCTSSTTTKAPAGNNDGTTAEGGADEAGINLRGFGKHLPGI